MHTLISKRYDLFVFDWDGTLEKVRYIYKLNERLNPFWKNRKRSSFENATSAYEDSEIERQLKRLESLEEMDERRFKGILDLYMLFTKPMLQDDSLAVLRSLHGKRKMIAIFSNGALWRVKKEIKALGISSYFNSMVSAQSLGYLKPNPLGINVIMKKCNAARSRTLYIGDMVDDIKTARAARVDSCGIAAGFDDYTALEDEKPTYLFRNMRDFRNAL